MQENLVIVESPAKAKTIEKFLGKDFKVMSSYGHIRDLKKKSLSIDEETMEPCYEIPEDKRKVVKELRDNASKAKKIWLASDEDREGEAISWHLCEVLGLDEAKTSRIVFHEITKPAILQAITHPRHVDMNLVNAQQARRVLDRIVGFKISPVLWKKVGPSLSAGRVQSVAVRLIVEKEREIHAFQSETYYRVTATFGLVASDGSASEVKAELDRRFKTHEEVEAFLEKCKDATFTVESVAKKPAKRSPAPPFTTSTLQQEAARKLGLTVSQTMMVAQHLYENGLITYMRTDSVNLSGFCIATSKEEIVKLYGEEYSNPRNYHTHSKGAQEAHEAIRPTQMATTQIDGNTHERRLYELIWKRTAASQMADAKFEKTTVTIAIDSVPEKFVATGEVIAFDGFLKVYRESTDDDTTEGQEESTRLLPAMSEGDVLQRREIVATQKFTLPPSRYTEASLVHKLEELGIGRPSTYAPTISTIQQRKYVIKGNRPGVERPYTVDTLKGIQVTSKTKKEMAGADKGKLLPTDVGIVVNDFLVECFPEIMDYNFTANVEQRFDDIAEGKTDWIAWMKKFDKSFKPEVDQAFNARSEHRVGERMLGNDPASGLPVFVKIGRFGPMAQIGAAEGETKPRFAQIPPDKSIETITLEEVLELFELPRTLGDFEGSPVVIGAGKYGPYVLHEKKYTSLPEGVDPMAITLPEAIELVKKRREEDERKHIKHFEEEPGMEILNGKFGPYISYGKKNYGLPKELQAKAAELTYEQCVEIINNAPATKGYRRKR